MEANGLSIEMNMDLLQDFKKRSEMHWARKIWHMCGVSALAFAYYYLSFFLVIDLLSHFVVALCPYRFFTFTLTGS